LNLSAQAITGRHTNWSSSTMTAIITAIPTIFRACPGAGGNLQVRTKARQAKIAVAENEHFAGHQEKPSARYRHHRIPDQSNRAVRQLKLHKTLHALKRYRRAASSSSRGIALSEA